MQMQSKLKTIKTAVRLILLFVILSVNSFSQTNRFSISITSTNTNFNYKKLNSSLQPYKKDFKGLQIGASYQVGVSRLFSVVPGVYFAMKGGNLKQNNPITENKSTVRLYTVDMPVLARLHFNNLYLNAGPYIAYTLGGRFKTSASETLPAKSTAILFGNSPVDFKRWDFGAQAGAGYNFNLKKSILTLDVRYGYGLIRISKDTERYNRMFSISLIGSKPAKRNINHNSGAK
jgi:hypothetical protein